MAQHRNIMGLVAIIGFFVSILVMVVGFSAPAAAEFFGCNDTRGKVLSSSTTVTYADGRHYTIRSRRYTHEFAARPVYRHHVTHNGARKRYTAHDR